MSTMSYAELEEQAFQTRSVCRLFQLLNLHSGRALEMQGRGQALKNKSEDLARLHPEYASPDHRVIAIHWILLAAMPAVCLLDFLLISNAAEYLATLLFPHQPLMGLIARIFTPVGFLVVELLFAVKLHAARERAENTGQPSAAPSWGLAGLTWAGAISVVVLASQVAANSAEGVGLQRSAVLLMCGVTTIAFLLHLLVLLGGRQLRDANGYFVFSVKQGWYAMRERKAVRCEAGARRKAEDTFSEIVVAVGSYNRRYQAEPFLPPPLAKSSGIVIREAFGDQVQRPENTSAAEILNPALETNGGGGRRPVKGGALP